MPPTNDILALSNNLVQKFGPDHFFTNNAIFKYVNTNHDGINKIAQAAKTGYQMMEITKIAGELIFAFIEDKGKIGKKVIIKISDLIADKAVSILAEAIGAYYGGFAVAFLANQIFKWLKLNEFTSKIVSSVLNFVWFNGKSDPDDPGPFTSASEIVEIPKEILKESIRMIFPEYYPMPKEIIKNQEPRFQLTDVLSEIADTSVQVVSTAADVSVQIISVVAKTSIEVVTTPFRIVSWLGRQLDDTFASSNRRRDRVRDRAYN